MHYLGKDGCGDDVEIDPIDVISDDPPDDDNNSCCNGTRFE